MISGFTLSWLGWAGSIPCTELPATDSAIFPRIKVTILKIESRIYPHKLLMADIKGIWNILNFLSDFLLKVSSLYVQ